MRKIQALTCRLSTARGQTLAEYAILVTMIAIVVIAVAAVLGANITGVFNSNARGV